MPQTLEAQAFLDRIASLPPGPGVSLDAAVQPCLDDEAQLRKLFATDRGNARLSNPYVGLVDVFDAPQTIRTTRARVVHDEEDLIAKHTMPLTEKTRRKEGEACMVSTMEEFKANWSVFTEGSLSQLPLGENGWANVVAAGGSVLGCVAPLPDDAKVSKRATRKWYHNAKYPTSDVDLFLYGMTPEQAEVRINEIYEAVRDGVPWDVTCIRTKHTVSIHSQYPYRSIQIVLRLYASPAEIMAGFDVDAPCFAYDGRTVWANPRAIVASMRQSNTVDMTRRSPSYEVRLSKYASRGFEVYVPTLRRKDIDPTIYERAVARITGLARLLVLEKLADPDTRAAFMDARRVLRGRPNTAQNRWRHKKKYKGDLKQDLSISGLEMNDYDVASLHIPYGPGWDARRIDKLVYQTDLGMNSTFNPKNKNRRLHRHPAFFGTMQECLEDCCETCPDPIDDDEKALEKEELETYVKGRISFIAEDPGRQSMTGSFNPIDVGEWSDMAYVGETEKFFAAIAANDRAAVHAMIQEQEVLDAQALVNFEAKVKAKAEADAASQPPAVPEGQAAEYLEKPASLKKAYLNRRDHVGRTALHLAVMCKHEDIACDLIDAGARITARIVDGRTALHMAARLDLVAVVKKLLAKSHENKEEAIRSGKLERDEGEGDVKMGDVEAEADRVRDSSEDDWSSDENDGDVEMSEAEDEDDDEDGDGEDEDDDDEGGPKKKKADGDDVVLVGDNTNGIPDDEDDLDILNINEPDWDLAFTALHYAALFATIPVLDVLIASGADVHLATQARSYDASPLHPLSMTLIRSSEDPKYAAKVAERLLTAGATSSPADTEFHTLFMRAVEMNHVRLVETLLRHDKNTKQVIDFPWMPYGAIVFPVVSALCRGNYGMVAVLLAHGAKLTFTEEEVGKIKASLGNKSQQNHYYQNSNSTLMSLVNAPIETAIYQYDDIYQLLIILGADVNTWLRTFHTTDTPLFFRKTILDWVHSAKEAVEKRIDTLRSSPPPEDAADVDNWDTRFTQYLKSVDNYSTPTNSRAQEEVDREVSVLGEINDYILEAERFIVSRGGKTAQEMHPPPEHIPPASRATSEYPTDDTPEIPAQFARINSSSYPMCTNVHAHEVEPYRKLFEACYNGDNDEIERLCLPSKSSDTTDPPLQITAISFRDTRSWRSTYYSTLFAAILGRKWHTAKLIIAIASAQYKPDEAEAEFDTSGIHLDSDDSDSDSDASDDSDMTVDQKAFTFVDIATRPSSVECNVHPKKLLENLVNWVQKANGDIKYDTLRTGTMLQKAIEEGDAEAFVHIANLYKGLPEPLELPNLLAEIIRVDQPAILDEYIRRTGEGIDITDETNTDEGEVQATNDSDRVYLGLNVHGKKRADLARRNDPNAFHAQKSTVPLLWQAALARAKNIFEYLCTDKPLTAYNTFATSSSQERALKLRRVKNLETVLPEWLGWKIDSVGESPLTAAVFGKSLDIVKMIFKKSPSLASSSLKTPIKFIHWNVLTLAVYQKNEPPMIDFLLANGVSALPTEGMKWRNILHFCCRTGGNTVLLEHLLKVLPKDVVEAFLLQQTLEEAVTPLHLAIESANTRSVELILARMNKKGLLLRNMNGSTPLHEAVSRGLPKITKLVIDASPPEALFMENGVGETPFETAIAQDVINRSRGDSRAVRPSSLQMSQLPTTVGGGLLISTAAKLFKSSDRGPAVTELRSALDRLLSDGVLDPHGSLAKELLVFANRAETKLAMAKPDDDDDTSKEEDDPDATDVADRKQTLEYVKAAITLHEGPRRLVHLNDVQRVVKGSLPRYGEEVKKNKETSGDDGLEGEEEEEKWRSGSVVLIRIHHHVDGRW
ncbi:hypothetical protein HGRIS_009017 [Hohenbuehelia grisea]|uniref:Ankyrin repeat protein n=1 Tax=Hohenbuehelia grisea TaxID=104357 RepID=A0ABR3J085_9AGAR